ncbi:MAG: hypothetical protein K9G71_01410 [Rhodobacteraceae bacterium]|nr:hypothetical protein [Paracoccaceae bacterium]MCF8512985.1 hypothetical protein [Paracoccaceae bacterium]MCF8517230.1 hypothetical protein [Paracoccaceae bacterium]
MSTNIRLAPQRIEQLRILAESEGKTIPEVISGFIAGAVSEGRLNPDLPGVAIRIDDDVLTMEAGKFKASMPANSAQAFSAGLRATLIASSESDKRRVSNLLTDMLSAFGGTEIIRAGNHISLASPIAAKDLIVPKSVVVDLADQIDRAAKAS